MAHTKIELSKIDNNSSIKQKRNITIDFNSDIKALSLKVKKPCLFYNNKYLSLEAHLNSLNLLLKST